MILFDSKSDKSDIKKKTTLESWINACKILSIQIRLRLVLFSLNRMIFDILMTEYVTEYYLKY